MTEQEQLDLTTSATKTAVNVLEHYFDCVTIIGIKLLPDGSYIRTFDGAGHTTARFVSIVDYISNSTILDASVLPKEAQEVIAAAKKFIAVMTQNQP